MTFATIGLIILTPVVIYLVSYFAGRGWTTGRLQATEHFMRRYGRNVIGQENDDG